VLERIKRLKEFVADTWAELKKTTWPAKTEVYGTTLVVIVTVLICAFYLWIVDLLLKQGMEAIYQVFGQ
jgi:preprotein translocase subunit SecE